MLAIAAQTAEPNGWNIFERTLENPVGNIRFFLIATKGKWNIKKRITPLLFMGKSIGNKKIKWKRKITEHALI